MTEFSFLGKLFPTFNYSILCLKTLAFCVIRTFKDESLLADAWGKIKSHLNSGLSTWRCLSSCVSQMPGMWVTHFVLYTSERIISISGSWHLLQMHTAWPPSASESLSNMEILPKSQVRDVPVEVMLKCDPAVTFKLSSMILQVLDNTITALCWTLFVFVCIFAQASDHENLFFVYLL